MEVFRVERLSGILVSLKKQREEVESEMKEILADMSYTKKAMSSQESRVARLKAYVVMAELRLPRIEHEMEHCEPGDVNSGWSVALENEYTRMINQLAICREEVRLRRIQLRDSKTELHRLQLEMEECEQELDLLLCREVEAFEALRRLELTRAHRRAREQRERKIREEVFKWKIDDIRRTVIKRDKRPDLHRIEDAAKGTMTIDYYKTVAFAKKDDQHFVEAELKREMEKRAVTARHMDPLVNYKSLAAPIEPTYDNIVRNTLSILRTSTVDMRYNEFDMVTQNGGTIDELVASGKITTEAPSSSAMMTGRPFTSSSEGMPTSRPKSVSQMVREQGGL